MTAMLTNAAASDLSLAAEATGDPVYKHKAADSPEHVSKYVKEPVRMIKTDISPGGCEDRKSEEGSASVSEYTLVLPLCLIAVSALISFGMYLCRYAVLDSVADRAVIIVRGMYADADFTEIADFGLGEGEADHVGIKACRERYGLCGCDPYRFLSGGYDRDKARRLVEEKARVILGGIGFLDSLQGASCPEIILSETPGLPGKQIRVTVRQKVKLPVITGWLSGEPVVTMQASSAAALSCPQEMVRSTDLILDIAKRTTGTDIRAKIESVFSKVVSSISPG